MPSSEQTIRKLTQKQANVLQFIIDYIDEHSYPPSIRNVGDHIGIKSTNGVFDHLNALARKGYIKRETFAARCLTVLRTPEGKPKRSLLAVEVEKLLALIERYKMDGAAQKQIKKLQGLIAE